MGIGIGMGQGMGDGTGSGAGREQGDPPAPAPPAPLNKVVKAAIICWRHIDGSPWAAHAWKSVQA